MKATIDDLRCECGLALVGCMDMDGRIDHFVCDSPRCEHHGKRFEPFTVELKVIEHAGTDDH